MNNIRIYAIILALIFTVNAFSQTTNPDSNYCEPRLPVVIDLSLQNIKNNLIEHSSQSNCNWDWRTDHYYVYTIFDEEPKAIKSPFFSDYDNTDAFFNAQYKDYNPTDGWELIGRYHFGNDGYYVVPGRYPTLVLYNKYTAILRTFIYVGEGVGELITGAVVNLELSYEKNGILSYNESPSSALDNYNEQAKISVPNYAPSNGGYWLHADFQLAYDPCTCRHQMFLNISHGYIRSGEININITGDITSNETITVGSQGSANVNKDASYILKQLSGLKSKMLASGKSASSSLTEIDKFIDKHLVEEMTREEFEKWYTNKYDTELCGDDVCAFSKDDKFYPMLVEHEALFEIPSWITKSVPYVGMVLGAFDFINSFVKKKDTPNTKRQIPIVQKVDLVATGTNTVSTQHESSISFSVPNSNQVGLENVRIPKYNKPLGVFNLLRTPVLKRIRYRNEEFNLGDACFFKTPKLAAYQLQNVDYVINPSSELEIIDIKGTLVFSSLENKDFSYARLSVEIENAPPENGEYVGRSEYHYSLKNNFGPFSFGQPDKYNNYNDKKYNLSGEQLHFIKTINSQGYEIDRALKDSLNTKNTKFRTEYLPLNCLLKKSIILGGDEENHLFNLKLVVTFKTPYNDTLLFAQTYNVKTEDLFDEVFDYEFNFLSEFNTSSFFIYGNDYNFTTNNTPWQNNFINSYPTADLHISNQTISGYKEIKTTKSIYLENIHLEDDAHLKCIAGDKIVTNNDFTGNGNVEFEILNPEQTCGASVLPVDAASIASFCNSSDYPQNRSAKSINPKQKDIVLNENTQILLMPNPAKTEITINILNNKQADTDKYFEINNLYGVNVKSGVSANNNFNINISDLAPGIYILKIKIANNYYTEKFIKQ